MSTNHEFNVLSARQDRIHTFPGCLTVRVNADGTCEYSQGQGFPKSVRISRADAARLIWGIRKALASL